jgi:MoaA/NifB/PqqE/SkfB family radical SAM enzyme
MTETITDRIDAVTKIPEECLTPAPRAPRSVKIELTGRCNYRCGFCALRTRQIQPKKDIDFGLFKRITADMRASGVQEIGLFYLGESMMAPDLLISALRWTKQVLRFPYVFLTTNGSLADPDVVRAAMAAGLDSLKWSVNAATAEQFEKVMGINRKWFYKSLENLKNARRVRDDGSFDCGLYASSIRYDGEQQKKMESLLAEYVLPYVDEHYWLPLYSMGSLATQREEELGYRPTAGNQGRLGALREPLPCWSVFTEGHVTADGILTACCFDADARWAMGDLKNESFMSAWNSEAFRNLRQAHLLKDVTGTPCEDCVAYK